MKLTHGVGSPTTGACWMSAYKWMTGAAKWGDDPEDVDPVIRHLCIWLNDNTPIPELERIVGEHLCAPGGTWMGSELSLHRAYRVADFAVRVLTPHALRSAKLDTEATKLEALTAVTDKPTARAAGAAARAAARAAGAEIRAKVLTLILELCEMGRTSRETCRTKEQTLRCLEAGRFAD